MSATSLVGVYPGTFDPITIGHLDIIRRAARLVDRLVVGVAVNAGKSPLLTVEQRVELVSGEVDALPAADRPAQIEVRAFSSLLMDFAVSEKARMIIRGLRAVSDFEYEFQMAGMNSRLNPDVETIFLMASDRHQFIASRFVKDIGRRGGNIAPFVSPAVARVLTEEFARQTANGAKDVSRQTPPFTSGRA